MANTVFIIIFVLYGVSINIHHCLDESPNIPKCQDLWGGFISCDYNLTCVYGQLNTVKCSTSSSSKCEGPREWNATFPCYYCWQLPEDKYTCNKNMSCKGRRYETFCEIKHGTYCMGHRAFTRWKNCNNVNGYRWLTAMVYSLFFGGFGVDRFYLGYWQEGFAKLFSFGGFGAWTLIDIILTATGYLKPHDGSSFEDSGSGPLIFNE